MDYLQSSGSSSFNRIVFFLLVSSMLCAPASAVPGRKLAALVKEEPLVLQYHNGPVLKGNLIVNLLWYGRFSPSQRAVIVDFLRSLSAPRGSSSPPPPSVSSWWNTTEGYRGGGATTISLGRQLLDEGYSLGKSLKSADLVALARKAGSDARSLNVVLTSGDVAVEGFCMSRCGTHGQSGRGSAAPPYIWVGNPASQCPGQCAWPFHQPLYGPQTPPLAAPNGDVGVDGMVITLATMVAGAVTNPFGNGFFQGPKEAPLEAVSACTGVFGTGAYPGYPGKLLVDAATGASYNARGVAGRRYLVPAMWDPRTSRCLPLV